MSSDQHYELIIEPGRSDRNYWFDLWRYRELFQVLAWRDISVRYKQTVIGATWALVRPFLTMIVFTVVFGRLAQLPSEGGAPYALLVLSGVLPWQFFSTALTDASQSLVANSNLISKVYFPRMIVPAATIVVAFVDFLISFVILIGLMIWYRYLPTWRIGLLPIFVVFAIAASLGPGLWITALNVKYRDFRYVIPFLIQFGLYISPVGFSSHIVPNEWQFIYRLNPVVAVIDGFRWCILDGEIPLNPATLVSSLLVTTIFLLVGIVQFRKMESQFADIV